MKNDSVTKDEFQNGMSEVQVQMNDMREDIKDMRGDISDLRADIADVLDALHIFAKSVDERFERVEQRLDHHESIMVTKDYLDGRLKAYMPARM